MGFSSYTTKKKYKRYLLICVAFFSFSESFCREEVVNNKDEIVDVSQSQKSNDDDFFQTMSNKLKSMFNAEKSTNAKTQLAKISDAITEKVSASKPFDSLPGFMKELPAFDIKITSVDTDSSILISELKDNVVILFFTTTWCPNCPSVLQDLDMLQKKLESMNIKNVKIITLILDDDLNQNGVKAYFMMNNSRSLKQYRAIDPRQVGNVIKGVPTCLVQDKNGKIIWGFVGAANYQSQEFLNYIKHLTEK